MTVRAYVADRLAAASRDTWPELGHFVAETRPRAAGRILREWFIATAFAAAFFSFAPLLFAGPTARPPIAVAILFPAIVFGIGSLVRFFLKR